MGDDDKEQLSGGFVVMGTIGDQKPSPLQERIDGEWVTVVTTRERAQELAAKSHPTLKAKVVSKLISPEWAARINDNAECEALTLDGGICTQPMGHDYPCEEERRRPECDYG